MRGDDLEIDVIRAAYDLRRDDAPERAGRALARARRLGNIDHARALADVLNDYRHRRLDPDDIGATPEGLVHFRHRRQRGDTVEALFRNNSLDYGEQAAALQISQVYETITSALWVKAPRLEQGRLAAGGQSNGAGIPERIAQLFRHKYKPWAAWMRDPSSLFSVCSKCGRRNAHRITVCEGCAGKRFWRAQPNLGLVLDIAVFGSGLEAAAKTHKMRRQRTLKLLQLGLARYCDFG